MILHKSNFFELPFILFVLLLINSSCKKSTISNPSPVVVAQSRLGYITSTTTVSQGDSVKIAWSALRGGTPMKQSEVLVNGQVFVGFNGGKTKDLNTEQSYAFTDSIKFKAMATNTYKFRVFSDNSSGGIDITVIVPLNIKLFSGQRLGGGNDFWSSAEGKVFNQEQFVQQSNTIDLSFALLGDTLAPFLISTAQRPLEGLTTGVVGLKTFFRISELNFATAKAPDINGIATSGGTQKIYLKAGETYEFVNALGKKGLVKINAINLLSDNTKTIDFDIKVQE